MDRDGEGGESDVVYCRTLEFRGRFGKQAEWNFFISNLAAVSANKRRGISFSTEP